MEKESIILWGNPQDALRLIQQAVDGGLYHRMSITFKQITDIACELSILGFDCSLTFSCKPESRERKLRFTFSVGFEEFFMGSVSDEDNTYAAEELKKVEEFITKHTGKDGLFTYEYAE